MSTATDEFANPGRRRLLALLSTFFVIVAASYIVFTMWLASLDKSILIDWELQMRRNEAVPHWIRSWHRGAHSDTVQHFVIYFLPGMMAGFAGTLAAEWLGAHRRNPVTIGAVLLWMTLAAIDELRQRSVPSRSTSWSDLFAGWAGILAGLAMYTIARLAIGWVASWWRSRKTI